VRQNLRHRAHLLGLFNVRHLVDTVYLDATSVNLNLVGIHGRVGTRILAFSTRLGCLHGCLSSKNPDSQIGIAHTATGLFQNLNVIQIVASLASRLLQPKPQSAFVIRNQLAAEASFQQSQ
jgi:hypothetical protein